MVTLVREQAQTGGSEALLKLWTVLVVPVCVSGNWAEHWFNKYISKTEFNITKPLVALQKHTSVVTGACLSGQDGCHWCGVDLPSHQELLNAAKQVSMELDVPNCPCKSPCVDHVDPCFPDMALQGQKRQIQAMRYLWRGQAPWS